MFELKNTQVEVIDILQIEADARRMRAKVIAEGFAQFKARLAGLLASGGHSKAQA